MQQCILVCLRVCSMMRFSGMMRFPSMMLPPMVYGAVYRLVVYQLFVQCSGQ